jgi:hypothetical protein
MRFLIHTVSFIHPVNALSARVKKRSLLEEKRGQHVREE